MTGHKVEESSSMRTKKKVCSSFGLAKKISFESWPWPKDLTSKLFGISSTPVLKPFIKASKLLVTTSFSTLPVDTFHLAQPTLVLECVHLFVDLPAFPTKQAVKDYVKTTPHYVDIRGTRGEATNTEGVRRYYVSNKARLGSNCVEQITTMVNGVK